MAVQIPPGYAAVAVQMRNEGDPDPWYVTWGVDAGGAGGNIPGIGYHCAFALAGTLGQEFPTTTRVTGAHVRLGQDGGEPLVQFVPYTQTGPTGGAKLPQNCAVLIDKFTGLGGRKHRGRFFMPHIANEGSVSEVGLILASDVTNFQGKANQLLSILDNPGGVGTPAEGNAGLAMVILHQATATTPLPTPVTSLAVQPVISTQRRRLR